MPENSDLIKTVILGAGSFGTALGEIIASGSRKEALLLAIEPEVVQGITQNHENPLYFPGRKLSPLLKASLNPEILNKAGVIFLAVPSGVLEDYLKTLKTYIPKNALLVNLAKGLSRQGTSLIDSLKAFLPNTAAALKGPSFAHDLLNHSPTGLTFACEDPAHFKTLCGIFEKTCVSLEFSKDLLGVELSSVLKNIYAIAMGIADALYNSANTRFLFFTRIMKEFKTLFLDLGGQPETLFTYAGYGDFGLTALNDLSRNRTLGLFIGKGFLPRTSENSMVVEGIRSLELIQGQSKNPENFPILNRLLEICRGTQPPLAILKELEGCSEV